ncbi:MAG: deoxyribose-phosphate aldolase [Clostridia bacterium]|nr:deoxyribose-phosphate aldolase [Clostridia bacterium]
MHISRYLDHAVLKPQMTDQEVREAIKLGIDYKVQSVCVRPCDITMALEMCKGTETSVSCVLDFPHGDAPAEAKEALAKQYVDMGVREIDMVLNFGYLRSGLYEQVLDGIRRVVRQAHAKDVLVKVIFETGLLNTAQIQKGVELSIQAGADFVKTSTGFVAEAGGATVEAVQTMLRAAEGKAKVKPSGGVRNYETAKLYVDMGVARLGVGYNSTPVICDGEGDSPDSY